MSKERNQVLPGAGVWDSFYDKHVQAVLETRRSVPALRARLPKEARLEFLAWPIIAFNTVDELVQELQTKIHRHAEFLDAYVADPQFVAPLLAELTNYHFLPDSAKSLTRKIEEESNKCGSGALEAWFKRAKNEGEQDRKLWLRDWKTIAEVIECKNSPSQLKTEFHREKRRRQSIRAKWSEHFQAWDELQDLRKGHRFLPLQEVSLRE
jgi:hypothetical protein